MSLSQLRQLRQRLDNLFYFAFENLTLDQRLSFRNEIDEIDSQIRAMQEF